MNVITIPILYIIQIFISICDEYFLLSRGSFVAFFWNSNFFCDNMEEKRCFFTEKCCVMWFLDALYVDFFEKSAIIYLTRLFFEVNI